MSEKKKVLGSYESDGLSLTICHLTIATYLFYVSLAKLHPYLYFSLFNVTELYLFWPTVKD